MGTHTELVKIAGNGAEKSNLFLLILIPILISRIRIILGKLKVAQVSKKIPIFYETRSSIAMFTSLSWDN
jgi:hypothetical protein